LVTFFIDEQLFRKKATSLNQTKLHWFHFAAIF